MKEKRFLSPPTGQKDSPPPSAQSSHTPQSPLDRGEKTFSSLSDLELLTLCIYGEGRGEGLDGMLAVGSVVLNRVKERLYGENIKAVILKPFQFSCFNKNDSNHSILKNLAIDFADSLKGLVILNHAYWIAKGIIEGHLTSNVGNATHYHATSVAPEWRSAMRVIKQTGNHLFYVGR